MWGYFYYFQKTDASDLKFGVWLGFPKAHHKNTRKGKVGVTLG